MSFQLDGHQLDSVIPSQQGTIAQLTTRVAQLLADSVKVIRLPPLEDLCHSDSLPEWPSYYECQPCVRDVDDHL